MESVNALSADALLSKHFDLAQDAIAAATVASSAHPDDAAVRVQIANAHIRLAELAASVRRY